MGGTAEKRWLPARAQELLPRLQAVTGSRPPLPSRLELQRVRYSPITAAFRPLAELSHQIGSRRGLSSDASPDGSCQGVLLDIAELWERYVLGVLRSAAADVEVRHGTFDDSASKALFTSASDGTLLGRLRPDAVLMRRHRVVGIVDAKYKRLWPSANAPHGPQRDDLYQLAAYVMRYGQDDKRVWGALVYPTDPDSVGAPPAEARGPWYLGGDRRVFFLTIPHEPVDAIQKIGTILEARADASTYAA
jgi:5-methylcytosine-specific restriction enzyme subunit McrC